MFSGNDRDRAERIERYKKYILDARTELDLYDQGELNLNSEELIKHMTSIIEHMSLIRNNAPEFCKNVTFLYLVRAYMYRGWEFFGDGKLFEALADYLCANKLDSKNEGVKESLVECYHALGHQFMMGNDFQSAVEYFSRADKLGVNNEEVAEEIKSNLADCQKFLAEHKELAEKLREQARARGVVEFHANPPIENTDQDTPKLFRPKPRKIERLDSEPQSISTNGAKEIKIGSNNSSFDRLSDGQRPASPVPADTDPTITESKKHNRKK